MATDIKISQMPAAASLVGDELIPIVQSSSNKTTTVSKIKEGLVTTEQLANKVDKDGSKVLSDVNFTTTLKNKLDGIEENANNYIHPSGPGNMHIPSGGQEGQILICNGSGSVVWGNQTEYTLQPAGESIGGVKQGAAVEDATSAEDIVAQFNALLASLRTAGVIATGAAAASFSVMSANVTSETPSENIIDFAPPMPIEKGKLYKENGIVYRCIQTSKLSVSNKLSDLVGYYVELV